MAGVIWRFADWVAERAEAGSGWRLVATECTGYWSCGAGNPAVGADRRERDWPAAWILCDLCRSVRSGNFGVAIRLAATAELEECADGNCGTADCMALYAGGHCCCACGEWAGRIEFFRWVVVDGDTLRAVGAVCGVGADCGVAAGLSRADELAVGILDVAESAGLCGVHHSSTGAGGHQPDAARLGCACTGQIWRR